MSVKIADKLEQMNGQTYPLMDASAVEYKKRDGSTVRIDEILNNISENETYSKTEIDNLLKDKVSNSDIPTVTNDLTNELKEQYDTAVDKSHDHENKSVLDKLSDSDGTLFYNGQKIESDVDAYSKTESDEKYATKEHTHTTVNGHTIDADVPEGAIFTDTVYDDSEIKSELEKKANTSDIPVIDVTKEYVDNALKNKVNNATLANYTKTVDLKTKLSEFENDADFINSTVENLKNYYLKSETYSQDEVNTIISNINKLTMEVVTELPSEDISTSTIYLILVDEGKYIYSQNMYIHNKWATFGTTTIDLSGYVKTEELTKELAKKANTGDNISEFTNDAKYQTEENLSQALSSYVTSTDLSDHTTNTDIHVTSDEKTKWNNTSDKSHEHANQDVLDKFSESDGHVLFNGKVIQGSGSDADAYTKEETNSLLDTKANISDIPTVTNDLTDDLKKNYDNAVEKSHEHSNLSILEELTTDGNDLFFKGVNVTNITLPDGGRSYPVVMLDAKANQSYAINISSGYKECDLLVQAWKFTEGEQNVEGIVKIFNNSDSDNFYYSDNVEFTKSSCKIKDTFNIDSKFNSTKDNLYFSDEFDPSEFSSIIKIKEEE